MGSYGSGVTPILELFPLTLAQAADRLHLSPEAAAELVRLGELGAYLRAGEPGGSPPTLCFREVDLCTFTDRGEDAATARLVSLISALLRTYLREHPPHRPQGEDDPVLAHDRGHGIHAHIQLGAFQDWLRYRVPGRHADDARLHLTDTVRLALRRLGCRPMRGIRPLHRGDQVWASWWRIPQAVWSLSLEELAPLREEARQ
jgi:hypothetical protein